MRELILKMSISLDGFVSGPSGEMQWIFSGDQEAVAWSVAKVSDASLHIMGSRSFRDMAAFWQTAPGPFAAPMNSIPKAVFTKQGDSILEAAIVSDELAVQRHDGADSWAATYVAGGELADEIARLKAGDGKPILAHGGASFARSLIAQNLVDEYALLVHPILLGEGLPIFTDLPEPRRLTLVSSTPFPKGGMANIYRPI